jgi:hypothetical protein
VGGEVSRRRLREWEGVAELESSVGRGAVEWGGGAVEVGAGEGWA